MDKHTASDVFGAFVTVACTGFAAYWMLAL
jgi:hypothetical protein